MTYKIPLLFKIRRQLESYINAKFKKDSDGGIVIGGNYVPNNCWQGILQYLFEEEIIFTPKLIWNLPPEGEANFFSFFVPTKPLKPKTDGHEHNAFNQGSALYDPEKAISKAIGEMLERYSLAIYRNEDLIKASISSLKKTNQPFLDPRKISHFSEKQKELNSQFVFDEDSLFQWVWGKSLFNKKPILLPAQSVFWNYCHHKFKESYLAESNTNGTAGMFSLNSAILSGLYEIIQRDAFLIFWLNKISPPRINISGIKNKLFVQSIENLKSKGFSITFFDVTSDLNIPACVAILSDPSGYPKINVGGGCDMNPESAMKAAFGEALMGNYSIKYQPKDDQLVSSKSSLLSLCFADRKGKEARMLYWADPKNFAKCEFFFGGREESYDEFEKRFMPLENKKEQLEHVINILKNKGEEYEPYFYEAKNKALKDLGYHAVRVIIPKLVSFYLSDKYASLGSTRLAEVPPILGFEPAQTLNEWPHPFP